ncbi:MAG: hypothetical protein NTZ33_14520 [Bacteroidetes bacterium]|nr:hypothetical protein [Bacteroidota bacterium]
MEGKYNEVEQLFIKEILDQHGEYLTDLFVTAIEAKKLVNTGELLAGISYRVEKRGNNFILSFTFPEYGRQIEIRYHKSKNAQKLKPINTNRLLWNIRSKTDKSAKNKDARWYAKNLYGAQNTLIGRLGVEYTKDEILRLKNIIADSKTRGTYVQLLDRSVTTTAL